MEHIEFRKQRDFGMIFNDTFAFVRNNFKPLGKALVFIALPALLLGGLFTGMAMSGFMTSFMSMLPDLANQRDPRPEELIGIFTSLFSWKFGAGILMSMVGSLLLYGVGLVFIRNYIRGQSLEVADIWAGIQGELGTLFTTILGGGIVFFLFITVSALLNLLPCLGTVGWIILILFAASLFMLLFPLRMEEEGGLFEAISRGRALLKGRWWQTVGLMLLIGIIVGLTALVFTMPIQWYLQSGMTETIIKSTPVAC